MINWKLNPDDIRVAKHVDCYWFLEKERHDTGSGFPRLYPDPAAHIILSRRDYQYRYTQEQTCFSGWGSYCLYPHRTTFVMDHSEPFQILGIKFKIGSLYSLNSMLDHTALESIVTFDVRKLLGTEPLNIEILLSKSAAHPEKVTEILDKTIVSLLQDVQEDRHLDLTRRALLLLRNTRIGELGNRLHCSQRTVERSFSKVTGLTLKQCQSMLRFEDILDYLFNADAASIDWLDIAYEFGFSDQPHLIRHLKSFIGATPEEYAKQRDLAIDVYGNFELD